MDQIRQELQTWYEPRTQTLCPHVRNTVTQESEVLLVVTSATLVVTGALLVVTMFAIRI